MNRSAVEKFAVKARRELQRLVSIKLSTLGITADEILPAKIAGDFLIIDEHPFPKSISPMRKRLADEVRSQGYDELVTTVAYTWFNRFCALRYMEVHDYIPYRVFTSNTGNNTPDIVNSAIEAAKELELPNSKLEEIMNLKLHGGKDNDLYRMLVIGQCNYLAKALPFLFQNENDYSELLLPDNLLQTDSIIKDLTNSVDESDWSEIEILGWLYQYYISEKKDEVIGKTVKKEDIPAATQLFTPNWIVRYMVDNSLGRLWMLNNQSSTVKADMEYYIQPESMETEFLKINSPEEISLIDPACGSGHILVYAFDLLFKIYEEHGYIGRDIPALILKHNLYGIDIDKRAAQLAAFALMMKARSKDRRFFTREVFPNVIEIKESNDFDIDGIIELIKASNNSDIEKNRILRCAELLKRIFTDAKNYGSLLRIPDSLSKQLAEMKKLLQSLNKDDFLFGAKSLEKLNELIKQAEFLSTKYEVCVANPPYMGSKGMNKQVKDFAKDEYPDSKSDLFAMFIDRNLDYIQKSGYSGMITMQSWMFLSSYKNMRESLLSKKTILSMLHLGARAFDSISGEVVSTTTFVIQNIYINSQKGSFFRLLEGKKEHEKQHEFKGALQAIEDKEKSSIFFSTTASDIKKIPDCPIAYWVTQKTLDLFDKCEPLKIPLNPKQGTSTGNDEKYVRFWFEITFSSLGLKVKSKSDKRYNNFKYFPLDKGGVFRKWYGNNEKVILFDDNAFNELLQIGNHLPSSKLYFLKGLTWSKLASGNLNVRFDDFGFIFSSVGLKGFPKENDLYNILGYMNSKVAQLFISIISSNLSIVSGDIEKIPYKKENIYTNIRVKDLCSCFQKDWDNFETSWDFTDLPILSEGLKTSSLKETWQNYWNYYQKLTSEMLKLEEENNRIFIEAYGLEDELTPEVPLKEITLTGNPVYKYGDGKTEDEYKERMLADTMKEFLSYGVGCMMGRYSLNKSGLILANQGETLEDFIEQIPDPSFTPDDDGIVPVIDQAYFEDDCAERFVEFLSVTFGKEELEENIHFIVDGLGLKGSDSPVEKLRKYFATQFFKDHMQRYKKRPIYWLMSSGKERAFQCLIYMHRYTASTLARIRTSYVHELQSKLSTRVKDLPDFIETASTTSEANKLKKEQSVIKKKISELAKFDEELRHLADQRIEIDLDDGVKRNYGLFGNLLAEKKAITGKK